MVASLAMLIEYLMGLSDSVIAGNILGETALSGLNLMQTPMNIVSFFACLFGTGTSICFSIETGRFDRRRATEMFSQGFWSALMVGSALAAALVVFRDPFLRIFKADSSVLSYTIPYWNWFVPCAVLETVCVLMANTIYADGDERLCFWGYILQLGSNFGVSALLCRWLGIAGCAMGSVVGNLAVIGLLSVHFLRKANTLRLVWHFRMGDFMRICKSSFGDASIRLCWAGLFTLLNAYVIARFGSEMQPVLAVVLTVIGFSEAFNGVANAAQPIVGVYVGERNVTGVRRVMRAAELVTLCEGLFVMTTLLIWPQLVVKLMGINEPQIVAAACTAVRFVSVGIVFTALICLFNSYYLFIERESLSTMLTILSNFAVPLALYPIMGKIFGPNGVWAALSLSSMLTVVVFGGYLLIRYGRSMFPLLLVRGREANLFIFNLILTEKEIAETSAAVGDILRKAGAPDSTVLRAALMVEEVFMVVKDRNEGKTIHGEATLDLNDAEIILILRDDGEVFDITDSDAKITSLRTYLVASVMEAQPSKLNLTTTGYNRNVFRLSGGGAAKKP